MDYLLGKTTKMEIMNNYGVVIIPAGSVITAQSIRLLQLHKIDPSFIRSSIQIQSNRSVEDLLGKAVTSCVEEFKQMFELTAATGKVPLNDIRKRILPMITELGHNKHVFELFDAVKAKDEYTHVHNVGVSILSTLIGNWLKLEPKELDALALAGLLHDVGKIRLPIQLLTKPGKLTAEEYDLVKKHAIYGYEILKKTPGISGRVARVALQHHEREDGEGYPLGLKKEHIDFFSSIVAVADIFHAMYSVRPYHEPLSFHEIITQMNDGRFGKLNPQIVSLFIENIMERLVGQKVLLTSGQLGEVVYLNPHAFDRPLIKAGEAFIDLSKIRDVHIKEIVQ